MSDEPDNGGPNDSGSQQLVDPLEYVCSECKTAFDPNHDFCPSCSHPRPSEGWRRTRDYPDAWLGRVVKQRYRLLQRMGKGTFGSVYRARRPHLDDTYAVKIINLERTENDDGPSMRERVEREVQILSSISSPHIVNFHDFAELYQGTVAVIMDFVRGQTLKELLAGETRLELSRAIQFSIEIATGLREVHQRGVVHRDLKPDNVMIQSLGRRREFIEIIDFGVARFENEVRRTVGFIGTPRYTSPEQARGEDADRRSDIYTLGMLLFHMITGQPPYTSDNVTELLAAHSRKDAPKMSEVAPERTIPESLESLVQSMMAKSREDRPENMDVVLRALRPIRKQIEESKRHSSSLGANREKHDSLPPAFETDLKGGFGASHVTGEHDSLVDPETDDGNPFAGRPPSDIYTVAAEDRLIYCDDQNNIRVQVSNSEETHESTLMSFEEEVTCMACESPEWVVIGHANGSVVHADLKSESRETLFREPEGSRVASVATNPNGGRIVAGYDDGSVRFGARDDPQSQWDSLGSGAAVISIAVHDDGSCIAVARDDGTTDIYIPSRSRQSPTTTVDHDEIPESIDFSPDGYLVAVRFSDGNVRLFSALTGAHVSDSPRSVLEASGIFQATPGSTDDSD